MRSQQFYFSGGGLASLAAACCLVWECGHPGDSIHILEGPHPFPITDERTDLLGISLPGTDIAIQRHLRARLLQYGAHFLPGWAAVRLDFEESDEITVTAIHCATPERSSYMFQLHEGDLCFISLGDPLENAALGGVRTPPPFWQGMPPSVQLWERLARRSSCFGEPAYCLRQSETLGRVLFSAAFGGRTASLFRLLSRRNGTVVPADSPWRLAVRLEETPSGGAVLRGCGLAPTSGGRYVKKPMWHCSGSEILTELLCELRIGRKSAGSLTDLENVVVCAAPWLGMAFLPWSSTPPAIPESSANLAFLGPFSGTAPGAAACVRAACTAARTLSGKL